MLYLATASSPRLPMASNRTRARSYSSRDSVQLDRSLAMTPMLLSVQACWARLPRRS